MNNYDDEQIDDYIKENISFLLTESKDRNFYYDKIIEIKIFHYLETISILEEFNFKHFKNFLIANPDIYSIKDFYNYGLVNDGYKDALCFEERNSLSILKDKYRLSNKEYGLVLNTVSIVLIVHEFITFMRSPIVDKIQYALSYLQTIISSAKKLNLKSSYELSNKQLFSFDLNFLFKYKTIIKILSTLVKRPNHRNSNVSLNYLCYVIDTIAKNKNIKKNLANFTIPFLKDLKMIYPNELYEISKFDKSYILKKISEGLKLKIADDFERELLYRNIN